MKHPFWDRILMLICALAALAAGAGLVMLALGRISIGQITGLLGRVDTDRSIVKAILGAAAAVCGLFGVFMLSMMTPARKKRSSNFAIQRNENGMVRISLKALETLVSKCLNQHAELKVLTSSLYSDEESIRVDVHIALQSDISMPLAISSLQKQIKRYIEACSGVQVQEVRVFVDSTLPSDGTAAKSPYAIPDALLGGADALSEGRAPEAPAAPETPAPDFMQEAAAAAAAAEPAPEAPAACEAPSSEATEAAEAAEETPPADAPAGWETAAPAQAQPDENEEERQGETP